MGRDARRCGGESKVPGPKSKVGIAGEWSGVRSRLNNSKESGRSLWRAATYGGTMSGPDTFFERDLRRDGTPNKSKVPGPKSEVECTSLMGTGLEGVGTQSRDSVPVLCPVPS